MDDKCIISYFIFNLFLSGTVRRFLEKQKDKVTAVVFCMITSSDTEIYKRYVIKPVCFPNKGDEITISYNPNNSFEHVMEYLGMITVRLNFYELNIL